MRNNKMKTFVKLTSQFFLFILFSLSFLSELKAQNNKQYECALRVDHYGDVSIEGRLLLNIGDTVKYQDNVAVNTILYANVSILPSTRNTQNNMIDIIFKVTPYDERSQKMKSDLMISVQTVDINQLQTQFLLTDSNKVDYYLDCKKIIE